VEEAGFLELSEENSTKNWRRNQGVTTLQAGHNGGRCHFQLACRSQPCGTVNVCVKPCDVVQPSFRSTARASLAFVVVQGHARLHGCM